MVVFKLSPIHDIFYILTTFILPKILMNFSHLPLCSGFLSVLLHLMSLT